MIISVVLIMIITIIIIVISDFLMIVIIVLLMIMTITHLVAMGAGKVLWMPGVPKGCDHLTHDRFAAMIMIRSILTRMHYDDDNDVDDYDYDDDDVCPRAMIT